MSVLMSPIFQAPAGYIPNVRCVHPRTPASLVLRALLNLKLDKHLVFVTGWREIYTMYIYIYIHCISLYITVYHCISLYIIVYHCISLYITVYHCISLYDYLAIYIMYIYKYIHIYYNNPQKDPGCSRHFLCISRFPPFLSGGHSYKKDDDILFFLVVILCILYTCILYTSSIYILHRSVGLESTS